MFRSRKRCMPGVRPAQELSRREEASQRQAIAWLHTDAVAAVEELRFVHFSRGASIQRHFARRYFLNAALLDASTLLRIAFCRSAVFTSFVPMNFTWTAALPLNQV